jgi:hypothetical protein
MPDNFPNSPKDGTYIKDDFLTNAGVADATVGELDWEMVTIANASTPSYPASQNGVMRITTAGTADGDGEAFLLHPDMILLTGTNQSLRFRARYPDISGNAIAGNNFRIGFSTSVTAADNTVGVWVESDAGVITVEGASTNGDISEAAATVSTLTSGTTMVLGTWHDFAVFCEGTNANGGPKTVKLFVDGELAATIENFLLGSAETMELSIVHWQDTGGAATLELDIDYIEAWLPRN